MPTSRPMADFGCVPGAEFRHDVIDMTTNRALADEQCTRDLPVGQTLGKQLGHLTFAPRQPARAVFVLRFLVVCCLVRVAVGLVGEGQLNGLLRR